MLLASEFDKSRFLKAEDLKGAAKRVRIKAVTDEQVGPNKERKLVLSFTNDERALVCNLTNLRTLQGKFGDDTAGWVGKIIELISTMTDFRGHMVPALRVQIPPPKGNGQAAAQPSKPVEEPVAKPTPTLAEELDDDIPWK
jgi:hypothetical protein